MEASLEHSLKSKTLGEKNLRLPERGIDGNYLVGMVSGNRSEQRFVATEAACISDTPNIARSCGALTDARLG